jgi:hypothetical protein
MITLSSNNANVQEFLETVRKTLRKHRYKLILCVDELLINDNAVAGWFDEDAKEIVVSLKCEDYLENLVHEYNHFLQLIECEPKYLVLSRGDSNMLEELWGWLDGDFEFVSVKRKNIVFSSVLEMELDCERRSVEMIKKYELPISLENYTHAAWVYIHYYNYVKKYRTWLCEDIGMHDMVELKEFPGNLSDDFRKLPPGFAEIFKKYSKTVSRRPSKK